MLFAAVSVVWGMPYLFIKIAVDDGITPGFLAWSRVTLAGTSVGLMMRRATEATDATLPPC